MGQPGSQSSTAPADAASGGVGQGTAVPGAGAQVAGVQVAGGAEAGWIITPREIAIDIIEHVRFPEIGIRMNPSVGLVAVPGWFWVEGYDGRPFGSGRTVEIPSEIADDVPLAAVPADDPRRRAGRLSVEVRVWPARYEWDFGDGTRRASQSLGQPYPHESEVKHTYEFSSARSPGGFPVRLTVEFHAEYRVNGGPAQPLAAARRTYENRYRVQEIQTVLVAP
jgi:hypothetical protein